MEGSLIARAGSECRGSALSSGSESDERTTVWLSSSERSFSGAGGSGGTTATGLVVSPLLASLSVTLLCLLALSASEVSSSSGDLE